MSLVDHPLAVALAVFRLEDDDAELQAAVIQHDESLWLVATWLAPLAGGTPIPERLVPLEKLEHQWQMPSGPYRLERRIPKALFDREISPELRASLGVVEYPSISRTHGSASSH